MLTISLRQFQLKPSKYLSQLPLTLTVYGKPVATVNTYGGQKTEKVLTHKKDLKELLGDTKVEYDLPESKGEELCPRHHSPLLGNGIYSCGCQI
jgi:hypothetical protein